MRKIVLFSILLVAAVFCGCQHFVFSPYFSVEQSALNWIWIRHYNYKTTPVQRVSIRIDGSGIVTVREGTSMLVTNPFAANANESSWGDIRENRLTIPPESTVPLFQSLVDKGLFKERKVTIKSDSTNEAVFASANFNGKACGSEDDIFTCDPDLAEQLKMIVMMFYHPQPRNRR